MRTYFLHNVIRIKAFRIHYFLFSKCFHRSQSLEIVSYWFFKFWSVFTLIQCQKQVCCNSNGARRTQAAFVIFSLRRCGLVFQEPPSLRTEQCCWRSLTKKDLSTSFSFSAPELVGWAWTCRRLTQSSSLTAIGIPTRLVPRSCWNMQNILNFVSSPFHLVYVLFSIHGFMSKY